MSSLEIKLRSAPRVSGTVQRIAQGDKGEPGGYYVPALAEDGRLAWTPSAADMPAVEPMEIVAQIDMATDEEVLAMLAELGALPVAADSDGAVIVDANGTIVM